MGYTYDKRRTPAAESGVRQPQGNASAVPGVSFPNSSMLSMLGLDSGSSGMDLEAIMRARTAALRRQIPAAEAEADRLSRGVKGTTPQQVRQEMGERMGSDFSAVRFHTDEASAAQASDMGALAWTQGRDVYFGSDGFEPSVAAHELVHTVQQGAVSGSVPTVSAPMGAVQMAPPKNGSKDKKGWDKKERSKDNTERSKDNTERPKFTIGQKSTDGLPLVSDQMFNEHLRQSPPEISANNGGAGSKPWVKGKVNAFRRSLPKLSAFDDALRGKNLDFKTFQPIRYAMDDLAMLQIELDSSRNTDFVKNAMLSNAYRNIISQITAYVDKYAAKAKNNDQFAFLQDYLIRASADLADLTARHTVNLDNEEQIGSNHGNINQLAIMKVNDPGAPERKYNFFQNPKKTMYYKPKANNPVVEGSSEATYLNALGIPYGTETNENGVTKVIDRRGPEREIAYALLGQFLNSGLTVDTMDANRVVTDPNTNQEVKTTGSLALGAHGADAYNFNYKYLGASDKAFSVIEATTADKANKNTYGKRIAQQGEGLTEKSTEWEGQRELNSMDPGFLRDLNRLNMLDALTGHIDRHYGNVLIDVDAASGKYKGMKAIDNDFSFGVNQKMGTRTQYNPGMAEGMHFDAEMAERVMQTTPKDLDMLLGDRLNKNEMKALKGRFADMQKMIENTRKVDREHENEQGYDRKMVGSSEWRTRGRQIAEAELKNSMGNRAYSDNDSENSLIARHMFWAEGKRQRSMLNKKTEDEKKKLRALDMKIQTTTNFNSY